MYSFLSIAQSAEAEFKDRGSKFLAFAFCVQNITEIKKHQKALKLQHPKANHHCYAYRLGLDKNNYRTVDDGEPAGSAGRPILGVIDSNNLTNILIIIVRYFGGTLLGVPGLINAYKQSTQLALEATSIVSKMVQMQYKFEFEYNLMGKIQQLLKSLEGEITKTENGLFCTVYALVPLKNVPNIKLLTQEIHTLEYAPVED